MAVRHGYGKITGADALVFAYDTGDTRNSYRGEPTTNIIADPLYALGTKKAYHDTNNTGWGTVTRGRIEEVVGPFGKPVQAYSQELISYSSSNRSIEGQPQEVVNNANSLFNLAVGTTYRISVWIKATYTSTSQNRLYLSGAAAVGDGTNRQVTTEWQRFSKTFSPSTTGTYYMRHYDYSSKETGAKIWYALPQVEIDRGHDTQFTTGTRSNTQGLLDLTGRSTINLANVSFDANAQMTFDGTDDYVSLDTGSQLRFQDSPTFTVSLLFNWASIVGNTSNRQYLWENRTSGSNSYYVIVIDNVNHSSPALKAVMRGSVGEIRANSALPVFNTWISYTAIFNIESGTVTSFVNGEQTDTSTAEPFIGGISGTTAYIGSYYGTLSGGYKFNGDISNFKIYNRALTAAEIQANFKNYKKRFAGLDYYYDNSTDGGRWIRFWWYTGVGWPGHETAALGHPFGTFDSSNHYGFQRLPAGLTKSQVELLAKDGSGNVYKWDFANESSTAQRVWDSMTAGTQGVFANGGAFNPTVIAGAFHGTQQDSWQYRVSEGVASFLLDDDTCDCASTLNAGHAMCGGSGWNQQYAQPDGAYLRYGVDTLNDGGCLGPLPTRQLELYYRIKQ